MQAWLLTVAALGWLTSVSGAVLTYLSAFRLVEDGLDLDVLMTKENRPLSALGLLLVVVGATCGAGGTILAVLVTSE